MCVCVCVWGGEVCGLLTYVHEYEPIQIFRGIEAGRD